MRRALKSKIYGEIIEMGLILSKSNQIEKLRFRMTRKCFETKRSKEIKTYKR